MIEKLENPACRIFIGLLFVLGITFLSLSVVVNYKIPFTILIGAVVAFFLFRYPLFNICSLFMVVILVSPQFGSLNMTAGFADFFYNNFSSAIKISILEVWVIFSLVIYFLKYPILNIFTGQVAILRYSIVFLFVSTFSLFYGIVNVEANNALKEYRPLLFGFLSLLLIYIFLLSSNQNTIKRFIRVVIVLSCLKAIQGMYALIFLQQGYFYKGNLRVFGGVELLFFVWSLSLMLFVLARSFSAKDKIYMFLFTIPQFIMWAFSFARSIWVGGLISFLYCLFRASFNFKGVVYIILSVIIALLAVNFLLPDFAANAIDYFSSISITSDEVTNTVRIVEAQNAIANIRKSPFLGFGLGYQTKTYIDYQIDGMSVFTSQDLIHNTYLWLWVKMGILGPISFILLIFVTVLNGEKTYKQYKGVKDYYPAWILVISTASFIALCAILFFGNWLLNIRIMFFFGFVQAFIAFYHHRGRSVPASNLLGRR